MKRLHFGCLIFMIVARLILQATPLQAKLSVVTTTTDLAAIVNEIGGDLVSVSSIAKGTQDPHFVEAKPSFMTKVSHTDLVIAVGLDLEIGWLPSIIRGARNPNVNPGTAGYLEVGPQIQPIEIPQGNVTRASGDIHPFGNPHFWLDPIRAAQAGMSIAQRLSQLDATHANDFLEKAKAFSSRMEEKTKDWQKRIERSGIKKIVTYHKTLNYFFDRFQIENSATLEPKPGIPPTSGHILDIIHLIKEQNISHVWVENFFDPTVIKRIKQELPAIHSSIVPVSVDGAPGILTLDDLYESLVNTLVNAEK